jgi:hypothetical protein
VIGVAALASATGAATASAAKTPVAKATRLPIGLMRLVVGKGLLQVRPRRGSARAVCVDDRGIAD